MSESGSNLHLFTIYSNAILMFFYALLIPSLLRLFLYRSNYYFSWFSITLVSLTIPFMHFSPSMHLHLLHPISQSLLWQFSFSYSVNFIYSLRFSLHCIFFRWRFSSPLYFPNFRLLSLPYFYYSFTKSSIARRWTHVFFNFSMYSLFIFFSASFFYFSVNSLVSCWTIFMLWNALII